MKIIENSNIVDWDKYPEYICAIVMTTSVDIKTTKGLTVPAGEELTWLLDKSPSFKGEDVLLKDASINFLGGLGFENGYIANAEIDVDVREIHYKPKPKIDLSISIKAIEVEKC